MGAVIQGLGLRSYGLRFRGLNTWKRFLGKVMQHLCEGLLGKVLMYRYGRARAG